MIIGITGGYGSGKDSVADYLVNQTGFEKISLSDFLRRECEEEGMKLTRENLIDKGNELRSKFGPWILGKMARDSMDPSKDYVVVSIRNPYEVKELKKSKGFIMLYVTGPDDLRYKRVNSRRRAGERYSSIEEFLEMEAREMESSDADSQNISKVADMAHIVLDNRYDTLEQLYEVVDRMYADIKSGRLNRYICNS